MKIIKYELKNITVNNFFYLALVAHAVTQAIGGTELEDGLCAGGRLKARNGLQRVRTIPRNDRKSPYRGRCGPRPPRGADPIRILPRSGHQWCLNYSWCGVRLDHRRREVGLSCIPGLTLVSLLDRVEGCYKRQPLGLEAESHTRDTHFRNIRIIKQTNKPEQSPP